MVFIEFKWLVSRPLIFPRANKTYSQGREVLNKYVALHAAQLLQEGQPIPALGVFTQYGTSENPANFNLYRFVLTVQSQLSIPHAFHVEQLLYRLTLLDS